MSTKDVLTGLFFHTYDDDNILHYQGFIKGKVEDTYICQLFSFAWGEPSNIIQVKFSEMKNWKFYPDNQTMKDAYESYQRNIESKEMTIFSQVDSLLENL